MNYFDFVSRGTSWDLVNPPLPWARSVKEGVARAEVVPTEAHDLGGALNYEVTEQPLTDEEIEQWTQKASEHSKRSLCWPASPQPR